MEKVSGITPKTLLDRPRLEPHLGLYRKIYERLSRSRQWSEGGPQAIALSEIFSYCDGLGLHGEEFREKLVDLIQEMDAVFMDHYAKEAQRELAKYSGSDVVSQ
jgi:hypothetical protein